MFTYKKALGPKFCWASPTKATKLSIIKFLSKKTFMIRLGLTRCNMFFECKIFSSKNIFYKRKYF